ncbi:MAG: aminotransferase class I/II-fold pyridoxal phosphate-dependent enzyme, partial [Lachnospiraceae bacterium]|nr:aminotransferase class I/II-fold pyridoxal phosphate-dependent enzyme [Lachnospiraceae bacterium]
ETFYLVNGSTSGIMASIASTCNLGDTIIIGRNCHKSVYKAVELLGLHPVYIYPNVDKKNGMVINISIDKIGEIVDKHPEAKAVLLVSPTYEGMTIDINAIAHITRNRNIPLIIDEAHGAHFSFGEDFPKSAIDLGADVVIQSMHKTMPALTQTALLHVCTDCIATKKMRECIDYFETTSPSYLLTASIDDAFEFGIQNRNRFHQYYHELKRLKSRLKNLEKLYIVEVDDPGKIVISTSKTTMTGKQLYDILLRKYHLQMEMAQETYCLAMTSVCDTKEGFQRLSDALIEIDGTLERCCKKTDFFDEKITNICACTPYEAKRHQKKEILLEESIGKINGEYIYLYPPGTPFLVPGEVINELCVQKIKEYIVQSLNIKGLIYKEEIYIKVLEQ